MGRVVRVVAAAVIVVEGFAGAAYAAVTAERLCVRVYDTAGIASGDRVRALTRAGEILAGADVAIEWRDCSPRLFGMHPSCNEAPAKGELIVRMVRGASTNGTAFALGEAFVNTVTRTGVLATVFVDRIEAFAAQATTDVVSVVGSVVAHEIGHLLLGTNDHADEGLMRPSWTQADLTRNRDTDWLFTKGDVDRVRRNRSRRL